MAGHSVCSGYIIFNFANRGIPITVILFLLTALSPFNRIICNSHIPVRFPIYYPSCITYAAAINILPESNISFDKVFLQSTFHRNRFSKPQIATETPKSLISPNLTNSILSSRGTDAVSNLALILQAKPSESTFSRFNGLLFDNSRSFTNIFAGSGLNRGALPTVWALIGGKSVSIQTDRRKRGQRWVTNGGSLFIRRNLRKFRRETISRTSSSTLDSPARRNDFAFE